MECDGKGDAAVSQGPLLLLCFCLCVLEFLASTIGTTSKVESGTPEVGDCDVQTLPSQRCLDWASGLKIS